MLFFLIFYSSKNPEKKYHVPKKYLIILIVTKIDPDCSGANKNGRAIKNQTI